MIIFLFLQIQNGNQLINFSDIQTDSSSSMPTFILPFDGTYPPSPNIFQLTILDADVFYVYNPRLPFHCKKKHDFVQELHSNFSKFKCQQSSTVKHEKICAEFVVREQVFSPADVWRGVGAQYHELRTTLVGTIPHRFQYSIMKMVFLVSSICKRSF